MDYELTMYIKNDECYEPETFEGVWSILEDLEKVLVDIIILVGYHGHRSIT